MKLDRNITNDGRGKYALILMLNLPADPVGTAEVKRALEILGRHGCLDFGDTPDSEFFLIRLKDRFAASALTTYACQAFEAGQIEWSDEVQALAEKAKTHPSKKQPD